MFKFNARSAVQIAVASSLMSALSISSAFAAPTDDDPEAAAREAWRDAIVSTAVPDEGCFHATYPSTEWLKVACTAAPNRPYVPRHSGISRTVGDGDDYAAEGSGPITKTLGTFPTVTGVKTEKDGGESNIYSLQLNSNFMTTAVCNGHAGCQSWEQFVYSSGEEAAFMQYWLIDYGNCPSGWNEFSNDCYKNSAAVSVPQQPITELEKLKLAGTAVKNGKDTLTLTTETEAYSTTGKDSVVDLATGWLESEFNIVGDGGGSEAVFNKGSSITVRVALTDGSTAAPTCAADSGTTGETNNLSLKSCSGTSASMPYIKFIESN
jgi:hypothetical protein